MKYILLTLILVIVGCSTSIYDSGYEVIQGKLITTPFLDKDTKRLTIYIATSDGMNVIAIAENHENFDLLKQVSNDMANNKAMIYLFCKPVGMEWHEYVDSVDYEIFGIGYYDYYVQRYVTIITTYGSSFTDVLRSQDWAAFTTSLLKKGVGMAL